jgi:hypothetical protein
MKKKKTNRRSQTKYPALDPYLNLRTRSEFLDFDYLDKLPEKWTDPQTGKTINPKQWLNDFTNEHLHADFNSNKKRIHPKRKKPAEVNNILKELEEKLVQEMKLWSDYISNLKIRNKSKTKIKRVITKLKKELLKKTLKKEYIFLDDFYKSESYNRNNTRNSCVYTRALASLRVSGLADIPESVIENENVEDEMIERLDNRDNSSDNADNE